MITCRELDQLFDQLCDLTREMPGIDRLREAGELFDAAPAMVRRFLLQWRAAAAADLYYLEGLSTRSMSEQVGTSFQAITQWLQNHGPTHYLMVRKINDQPATLKTVAVQGRPTKRKLRQYREAGFRIAPATMNLLDGAEPHHKVVPERLWHQLKPESDASAA